MSTELNKIRYVSGNDELYFQNELLFSSGLEKEVKTLSEKIEDKKQQLSLLESNPIQFYSQKIQMENKILKELEEKLIVLNGRYYQDPNSLLHQTYKKISHDSWYQSKFNELLVERDNIQRTLDSIATSIEYNKNIQQKFLRLQEIEKLLHSLNVSLDLEWKVAEKTGNRTVYERIFEQSLELEKEKGSIISDLKHCYPNCGTPKSLVTDEIKTLESQMQEKAELLNLHSELRDWAMEKFNDNTNEFLVRHFNMANVFNCFKDKKTELIISNSYLHGLCIVDNKKAAIRPPALTSITKVINLISKFNHLETLWINADIQMLPPEIKQCSQLKTLDLTGNRELQALPPEIGNLTSLVYLKIVNNKIRALPQEIKHLTNLIQLDVHSNRIQALPDEIKYLQNIKQLNVSENLLETLPSEIGQLTKLNELYITDMHLQSLPPEIGFLKKLHRLFVYNNQLQGIPGSLARLPRICTIDAEENRLSLEAIQTFQAQIAQQRALNPNLGPQFQFSIHDNIPLSGESTIGEMISFWLNQFKTNFSSDNVNCKGLESLLTCENPLGTSLFQPFFDKLTARQIENMKQFLFRLKSTDDFKHPLACQGLVLDVARMLHGACTNEAFSEKLFLILERSLETCHDRVADALNDIYLQWCLYCQAKDLSPKKLAELLIGVRRLDIVNRFARKKIKEKSLGDQIEVFLYFKTKLKHVLNLPVSTEGMLYPKTAGITDQELESATALALNQTMSSEQILEILISSDHWRDNLKQENPAEFKKIDVEIFNLLEQLAEDTTLNSDQSKKKNDEIIAIRKEKIKPLEIELTKNWIATSGILPQ